MQNLQLEVVMFLKAYMLLSDKEWQDLFADSPASQSYAMSMWTRMRLMSNGATPNADGLRTHMAVCLNCGAVYKHWPNPFGVDLLRQCFAGSCGGYADTQWEATLLGRVMFYEPTAASRSPA